MYRVAIIGVGTGEKIGRGASVGYTHAATYRTVGCEIVGVADLSEANLANFVQSYPTPCTHTDYRAMLSEARPDIVSVATYAGLHRDMVIACAEAGAKGIWCEKPFCLTMDEGRAMIEACEQSGTRLIVNHQRRYLPAFHEAKRLLREGTIGQPVEFLASVQDWDLMEWGTHWLDMLRFFADDQPVQWVMGQVRCTGEKRNYGHLMEQHGVAYFCFEDGSRGLLDGGKAINGEYAIRLIGTTGIIDIPENGQLRVLDHQGWRDVPTRSSVHEIIMGDPADWPSNEPMPGEQPDSPWCGILRDLIGWIEGGPEPRVSGRNALKSSELYLAAYESAKRRDRVDLPLGEQPEFPLEAIAR